MLKNKKHNTDEHNGNLTDENKDQQNNLSGSPDENQSAGEQKLSSIDDCSKEKADSEKIKDEEISKLKKELETLTDSMKRRQADFENYKKHIVKSQEDQKKMIIRDFALDLIDINDNLLRAIEATCNVKPDQTVTEVCSSFSDGFSMISRRVEDTLKKYNIEEIISLNTPFDPNFNEAVEIDESSDIDTDTVTKVHQKGFRLDEFVIRTAKVKVTKARKKQESAESINTTDTETVQNDSTSGL